MATPTSLSAASCYCGAEKPEEKPFMLLCDGCKRTVHAGCLMSGKPSPLEGDIFYHFKCVQCGDEGKEELDRMKIQWTQVVILALYNLQLGGTGKCGYFRWKEHICAFIDKYWTLLFAQHRKKTSLWYGTVAGALSTGCPHYFESGAHKLGEAGWWRLTQMKPPSLKLDPGTRTTRKKIDPSPVADSNVKLEGRRLRTGKTSIQAAIELKMKRSTLLEAKEIRKAKAGRKTPESTVSNPSTSPASSDSVSMSSPLPAVETFGLFQPIDTPSRTSLQDGTPEEVQSTTSKQRRTSNETPSKSSNKGRSTETKTQKGITKSPRTVKSSSRSFRTNESSAFSDVMVKQETVDTSYDDAMMLGLKDDCSHHSGVSVKEEAPDSENSVASTSFLSSFGSQRHDHDDDSQFSHASSKELWFTEKDLKPQATVPQLLMKDDNSDSDLEIDPGSMSPPAGMSSACFSESPSIQDILSSIDDKSKVPQESPQASSEPGPSLMAKVKQEDTSPADSETENTENADDREDNESDAGEAEKMVGHRKRKLEEEQEEQEEKPPPPKYSYLSLYDEVQLLKKLNMAAQHQQLDPELARFRRKLVVRQLKRERGMPLFDIDHEVQKLARQEWGEAAGCEESDYVRSGQYVHSKKSGTDLRILDRFQCGRLGSRAQTQQFPSFLNRLVGTEDDQLQSITSPYTTRVLKPFIRRDQESKPVKMQLLEEIIAYPHRNDPTWTAPPSYPIDYCYVRPQHIPSINMLCREFFWPGIDLSECLQYPDFSCVVMYRKVVIGFAFMVPDVKYNEAYISFIFTHPEWRRAGIATFMLYHLIQTCMGKDVTLHVSATNTAMLLYQKFGFKAEEFILDFYDKYYPVDSRDCKHAFFLRLRR